MKDKPKVGDKLYVTFTRQNADPEECEVFKVGRLYFYVKSRKIHEHHDAKFNIKTWGQKLESGHAGSFDYYLYKNKSEYDSTTRASEMARKIRDSFNFSRLKDITNEQIFAIADILKIEG